MLTPVPHPFAFSPAPLTFQVADARSKGIPTVPTTMKLEKETNPFLRWDSAEIRSTYGMQDATGLAIFSETRKRKDNF